MSVLTKKVGPITYLALEGPISEIGLEDLKSAFQEVESRAPANVILDVADVERIDSRGLELLLDISSKLASSGGSLRLANAGGEFKRILSLTRLDKRLIIVEEESRSVL